MKRTTLFVLIALLISTTVSAQKVLKTHSGQRILLVDNGSWRLLSPVELTANKTEEDGSTNLGAFEAPTKGKYGVSETQKDELESLLKNFLSDEAQLCVNLEMSRRNQAKIEKQLKKAKKNKEDTKSLKQKLQRSKGEVKKEEKYYDSVGELIKSTHKILNGNEKNQSSAIASILDKYNSLETTNTGMGGAITAPIESNETVEIEKAEKDYPTTFKLDQEIGANPMKDCELVFDGYDNDIGKNRKEVKTQPFFSFTQEKMKPYFKNEDFLNCDANIAKVGKKYYLTLNIRIRSKEAGKTYGVLRLNENVKIEMIDGTSVYGRNINNDKGKIESYTGHTLYKGVYELSKDDIKDLKNSYLDNIGIIWSSGYEQYDIYNVDFLQNQLKCLTK